MNLRDWRFHENGKEKSRSEKDIVIRGYGFAVACFSGSPR